MSSSTGANGIVNLYILYKRVSFFALFWLNSEFADIEESVAFFILSFSKSVCRKGQFCYFTSDGLGFNSRPPARNCHLPVTDFVYPVA